MDYMIRATAAQGQIRAFAANTRELVETARIDGCTDFGIFMKIILPESRLP